MTIRGGRVVDLDAGRRSPPANEPELPLGRTLHRQLRGLSGRIYRRIVALRKQGHEVYQEGSMILFDGRRVPRSMLAWIMRRKQEAEPCKKA
jgi:hypothetical protein